MADIHIERTHSLGLDEARRVAGRWCEEAGKRLDLAFTTVAGEHHDEIEFERAGVKGSMRVEADRFTLDAKLGFLLGAFSKKIEAEIERNFDALLGAPSIGGERGDAHVAPG